MKILFIQETEEPAIGIMSLVSALKKHGHKCDVLIRECEKDIISEIKKTNPELIGLSFITPEAEEMKNLCKKIKKETGIKIIAGGAHATFFPEIISEWELDYICIGEGEYSFAELADRIEDGRITSDIPGIWAKNKRSIYRNEPSHLKEDINSLPFIDDSIYYKKYPWMKKKEVKQFVSGRGCPFCCSFCYNKRFFEIFKEKRRTRRMSSKRIVEELYLFKKKHSLRNISFVDYLFPYDKVTLHEFACLYKKKIAVPFEIQTRADLINKEVAMILKSAGCRGVFIGVETANEKTRVDLLKKRISNRQIRNAARIIKKERMLLGTYNMVYLPGECFLDLIETMKMNAEIKSDFLYPIKTKYFKNLDMTFDAINSGTIKERWIKKDFTLDYHFIYGGYKNENAYHLSALLASNKIYASAANFLVTLRLTWLFRFLGFLAKEIKAKKFYDVSNKYAAYYILKELKRMIKIR